MMRKLGTVEPSKLETYFPQSSREGATMPVEMAPNLEWVKGQVLGQITASKKFTSYANGNADGSQTAVLIAVYAGKTDAIGRVFLGEDDADSDLPTTGFSSFPVPTLECYYAGWFKQADLVGLDASALIDFGARIINDLVLIPS